MKKLGALYAVMGIALVLFFLWSARIGPFSGHPDPVDVAFADVVVEDDTVRVKGTAHLSVRLTQTVPARFGRPEHTRYLYPLFERGDTLGRTIRVMVATPVEPDDLAAYEDVTVEGWALPKAAAMNPSIEGVLKDQGYGFDEDYFVIEAFTD